MKKIFLVFISLIFLFCGRVYAEGDVKVNLKIGYGGAYKLGVLTPFDIEVENNGENIKGELLVEAPNSNNNITIYSMGIEIPKNSTKNFKMSIPLYKITSNLNVKVVSGKKTLFSEKINIPNGSDSSSLFVGVLSDDYDSLSYINAFNFNGNVVQAKNIKIDETLIASDEGAFQMFDIIVINNFNTEKLTKAQYEELKKWVYNGGALIIGTGPTYDKTLRIFKDNFLTGVKGELKNISTKKLGELIDDKRNNIYLDISALNININDSKKVISEGFPLIQSTKRGNGAVLLFSFDLGMEPIKSWGQNSIFIERAVKTSWEKFDSAYIEKMGGVANNLYELQGALKSIPELPPPREINFLVIFIIYILIVGPLSYSILKRMDKRELLWIVIPAVSIVFTTVVYITGYGTRVSEVTVNSISFIEADNNSQVIRTYGAVFDPSKKGIEVKNKNNEKITPFYLNNYGNPNFNGNKSIVENKVNISPNPYLLFYNTGLLNTNTFQYKGNIDKNLDIKSEVFYSGQLKGRVVNDSSYDIEGAYIISGDSFVKIGDLKVGEEKKIDNLDQGNFGGVFYNFIDQTYMTNYNVGNLKNKELIDARIKDQKRRILMSYFNDTGKGLIENFFIGWVKEEPEILANGKAVKNYNRTLLVKKIDLKLESGTNIVAIPSSYIKSSILNSSFPNEKGANNFFGIGSGELLYSVSEKFNLNEINFKTTFYGGQNNLNVKFYIYNNITNSYEEDNLSNRTIKYEELKKYLKDNKIRIKIESIANESSIELPIITVKGSVK